MCTHYIPSLIGAHLILYFSDVIILYLVISLLQQSLHLVMSMEGRGRGGERGEGVEEEGEGEREGRDWKRRERGRGRWREWKRRERGRGRRRER